MINLLHNISTPFISLINTCANSSQVLRAYAIDVCIVRRYKLQYIVRSEDSRLW